MVRDSLLSFSGGWGVLWIANQASATHWPTLLGGVLLTAPVWWRALTKGSVWPSRSLAEPSGPPALGESFYFYLSPVLLGFALREVSPDRFDASPGLVPLLIALPYLAVGLSQAGRRAFALVAGIALVLAALAQWSGVQAVWALLVLVHGWALMDHILKRKDGGWYALGTLAVALWHLLAVDLPGRPEIEPAFLGAWALTLWWSIETVVVLAAGLFREPEGMPPPGDRLRVMLWPSSGTPAAVRSDRRIDACPSILANSIGPPPIWLEAYSVSAWWICFAAVCFMVGFRRRMRTLRLAGFLVAGLALLKVLLVDLSTLDALYRVGSAFILGVVSLAIAYAYHRGGVKE